MNSNTDTNPLVSVLMTAYNRENYIAEAIESVMASKYHNWELIIVDDASKDATVAVAAQYASRDPRIKIFVNDHNLGDYPNRNRAASYAKGIYLKYLDADDCIYKYSLNYMVEAMEYYNEAAMGISFNMVDDGKPYPHLSTPIETIKAEYLGKGILGCGPSAAIIRKDVFDQFGGFSGKQYIGDHELWLQISKVYDVVKLQPSLIWWRQHPGQQIVQERNNIQIQNIRYHHSLESLLSTKDFFTEALFTKAIKNVKQKYAKDILRKVFLENRVFAGYQLWKLSRLSLVELLSGLNKAIS